MNRIKALREAAGFTQQELANAANIGRNTLSLYESSSFSGKIKADIQQRIATALNQPASIVFDTAQGESLSRRRLLTEAAGVGIGTLGLGMLTNIVPHRLARLSASDMTKLIDGNFATWQLLEGIQRGISLDQIDLVAQSKVIALSRLAENLFVSQQKRTVMLLLGDMYILLGRLQRDLMNYGTAEALFIEAIDIATEYESADLETAARHRLGNMMLLDQIKPTAALRNAYRLLEISKRATHPLWAEAQLMGGAAFAYTGNMAEAKRLVAVAQAKHGPDPEMWIGGIANPPAIYADISLIMSLGVSNYIDAYQHSIEALDLISKDYPDGLHWRLNVEGMQAQALWGLGDVEGAATVATKCLVSTRIIGNAANEARLERLYTAMIQSKYAHHSAIKAFGEQLRVA